MAEGQTATNPQTGERIVLRGGQWVPMGGVQAAPRQRRASRPQIRFQNDVDAVARTLIGEAGNQGEQGMLAVGGVIANRARQRGLSPSEVVLQPSQFEPWGNPETAQRLMAISPNSPEYQQAAAIAQRALAGEDITGGASHFYAPRAQQALGRARPAWDNGTGRAIGDHLFFNLDGSPAQDDVQLIGLPQEPQQPAIREGATATNPQTGERVTFSGGQWVPAGPIEVSIDQGVQNINGRAVVGGVDRGPWEDYWAGQERDQARRQQRVERMADPAYQAALADAVRGSENVPERLRALTQGGALGFLDEIVGGASYVDQAIINAANRVAGHPVEYSASMAAQAARDAEREAQARYAAQKPIENFALQVAGGFLTPGVGQAGRYIEGAQGLERLRRAGVVGAGLGAASGVGYGEGSLSQRIPDAIEGAGVGLGAGVVGQAGIDRLMRSGARQADSAARRLSRAGVDLTPGQMLAEVPIVGSAARYTEDIIGGYNPLMGAVRQRQNEDVIRAAGSEALSSIGEVLPREARTGYQVSQNVMRVLGDAYDEVLPRVQAQADGELYGALEDMAVRASQTLDDSHINRLERVLDENVIGRFNEDGSIGGEQFKRIETTLRQQSERANRPNSTLEDQDLSEFLDETRSIVRDLIARQNPAEAERIQDINRGYAAAARIRRAVSGSAAFAREGTPTPGELTQTVRQMSSENQIANQSGLLQGLASDARTVLPATVGDTGSGQRAVIGGAIGAIGTGAVATVNPALAGMIATGAVVYSRPGIAALNALYRATDSRAASEIVQGLAQQARSNPALLPYYEAALQFASGRAQTDTQALPQASPSSQALSPALQRVMQ